MKKLLTILLLTPLLSFAQEQKENKAYKDDVYGRSFGGDEKITPETLVIPLKNQQIFYQEVVEVYGNKQEIYLKARKWFVDHFKNAKSVLQIEDKDEGVLTGKALHSYKFDSGVNSSNVSIYFTLNVEIKDGRYRIQFYDMYGTDTKTNNLLDGLHALNSGVNGRYYNPNNAKTDFNINYTDAYLKFLNGKSKKYNTKLLKGMDDQVKWLFESFAKAVRTEKEDF